MKLLNTILIIFFLLFYFVTPVIAVSPVPDAFYEVDSTIQISLKSYPRTEVVRVVGNLDGKNNNIGDIDGDGLADIETEIVSMNLRGLNSTLGQVSLKNGLGDKKNMRVAEQFSRCLGLSTRPEILCPANSFFDIFVELRHTPFHNTAVGQEESLDVLVSCESVKLRGISRSLTDLTGYYIQRISGKITLCNRDGVPKGSLVIRSLKLHGFGDPAGI